VVVATKCVSLKTFLIFIQSSHVVFIASNGGIFKQTTNVVPYVTVCDPIMKSFIYFLN
jgi:hypothetical protein